MKHIETPKITVAIRKRPLNKKQSGKGQTDIIKIENRQSIIISQYKQKVDLTKYIEETTFNFDFAFDQNSTNEQIYEQSIRPLISSAFEGAKISCFAYGQTGSGKTFTMKGDIAKGIPGLYFLAAKQIFSFIEYPDFQRLNIVVSFYEIYCGKLFDLLNDRKQLKIRQDKHSNINIIGLQQKPIYSANQFLDTIEYGSTFRITSQNATNADSSRSHAIMQITIKDGKKIFSKVSFIDLAGNERGADHMDQNKQTKIDGAQINKSLLALKQCIRALDQGKGHTPFRGSKLTMVLKDSFVGFCKTVMIGNVSPNVSSSQNTINTLRYADRVKQLKKPSENLTKQEMQAKQLMLPRAANKNTVKVTIDRQDDAQDIQKKLDLAKKKLESQKMQIETPKQIPVTLEKRGSYKQSHTKEVIAKRAESSANAYRIQDRKSPNPKELMPIQNGSKKNITGSNSLSLQKNIVKQKIDENNMNLISHTNKNKHLIPPNNNSSPLKNISIEQLNRQHFEAMNSLHSTFTQFKDNHSKIVKEQTILIRDEMTKLGQMSEIQQFNNDADIYLDLVEKNIQSKIKLMEQLRSEVINLRKRKEQTEKISKILSEQRNQQQESIKSPTMQIQYPASKPLNNLSSMIVNSNPPAVKYSYHSVINNNNHQPISLNQQPKQPYQYSYSQINQQMGQNNQNIDDNRFQSGNSGYQYSQYHQRNNYTANHTGQNNQNNYLYQQNSSIYNHSNIQQNHHYHDEQLLEDLGDDHMQKLF